MRCVTVMRLPLMQHQREEPIGIVIADGGRGDLAPLFSAFVWGPVPDDPEVLEDVRELIAAS